MEHLQLLRASRPDFADGFNQRQAGNIISVPSLAIQKQSHGLRLFSLVTDPGNYTADQTQGNDFGKSA